MGCGAMTEQEQSDTERYATIESSSLRHATCKVRYRGLTDASRPGGSVRCNPCQPHFCTILASCTSLPGPGTCLVLSRTAWVVFVSTSSVSSPSDIHRPRPRLVRFLKTTQPFSFPFCRSSVFLPVALEPSPTVVVFLPCYTPRGRRGAYESREPESEVVVPPLPFNVASFPLLLLYRPLRYPAVCTKRVYD